MANQWFRVWHDMPNDPKWRTISKISGQPVSAVLAVFMHVLLSASTNATERGRTHGVNAEDIASAIDAETDHVQAILDAMQGRVLDGDAVSGWEKRQPAREDGSAERAKAWREAKKQASEREASDGERKRTQPNAPDTDTDTDTEREIKHTPNSPGGDSSAQLEPPEKPVTEKHRVKGVTKAQMRESFPDLTDQTIDDWITARKGKGAKTLTLTAWNAVVNEIRISGLTGEQALQIAAARNWQGVKSEWLLNHIAGSHGPPARAPATPAVSRNALEIQAWLESHGDERH